MRTTNKELVSDTSSSNELDSEDPDTATAGASVESQPFISEDDSRE